MRWWSAGFRGDVDAIMVPYGMDTIRAAAWQLGCKSLISVCHWRCVSVWRPVSVGFGIVAFTLQRVPPNRQLRALP